MKFVQNLCLCAVIAALAWVLSGTVTGLDPTSCARLRWLAAAAFGKLPV